MHLTREGRTFNFSNSAIRTLRSTKSNPLLKSAKSAQIEQPPLSVRSLRRYVVRELILVLWTDLSSRTGAGQSGHQCHLLNAPR